MTGEIITLLLVKFGPIALDWIADLAKVWTTTMTPEEVETFCLGKRQDYDKYISDERMSRVISTPAVIAGLGSTIGI